MKFQKAEVELILFDNSDVIVTSPGDLPCKSVLNQFSFCWAWGVGDSDKPTQCILDGEQDCNNLQSRINPQPCNTPSNHNIVNSPGPIDM